MTATTYSEFGEKTEGLEVAEKFAGKIQGKTILITGVNLKGIGFTTAQAFASQSPSTLIIAGRNLTRVQESIDALRSSYPAVTYLALNLDLSSQAAVRSSAAEVLSWTSVPQIDILVNNAAMMNIPERTLTPDGIELQFATNHVGHFLFASLIMPKLLAAAATSPRGATRIINVTSLSPTVAGMRWSDLNFEKINRTLPAAEQPPYDMHRRWGTTDPEGKAYIPLEGYNQSKVANVLFSVGLNARLYARHGVLSLAVHPGIMMSELGRYAAPETRAAVQGFMESGAVTVKTLGAGAATSVVAALDPALGVPEGEASRGVYLLDCQVSEAAGARATGGGEAERLWGLSEELVKERFAW